MDVFAKALLAADRILSSSPYKKMRQERYSSFDSGNGKAFEDGQLGLADLAKIAAEQDAIVQRSGQQELYENILNQYV